MSHEQTNTDFNSLEELNNKYNELKAKMEALTRKEQSIGEATPSLFQEDVAPPNALQTPLAAYATESTRRLASTEPSCEPTSLEHIKELEKFRLGVWIAKVFVILLAILVVGIMLIFSYISYVTQVLPDFNLITSILIQLKDVVITIIDTESK